MGTLVSVVKILAGLIGFGERFAAYLHDRAVRADQAKLDKGENDAATVASGLASLDVRVGNDRLDDAGIDAKLR